MKSDTLHTMDESLQYMDESLDTMEAVDGMQELIRRLP